jgi:hypothetical protein
MFLPIKSSTVFIIGLSIFMFLPQIHLLLILLIMSLTDWVEKLFTPVLTA